MVKVDHFASASLSYSKVIAGEQFNVETPEAYESRLIRQHGDDVFDSRLLPATIVVSARGKHYPAP